MSLGSGAPTPLAAFFVAGFAAVLAAQTPIARTFDDDRAGAEPAGFAFTAMRQAGAGAWLVQRTAARSHLMHTADPAARGFSLAIASGERWRDATISVRLRLSGGTRRGGIAWRYQSADDHYQVVLDLVRRELAMYRVVAGNRVRMDDEDDLELDAEAWHTLKIVHAGDEVRVSLGGIRVFEEVDRTFKIGTVGLVAAGDADIAFDDFRVTPYRKER